MAIKAAGVTAFMPAQQVAIYLRISKDREGLELGVERQEEDCRKIAERLGLPVYRVYKDNDLSGSKYARKVRPEYQQMLADARAGYFCTIIAYTSSRLTRRPMEHEGQIELAENYRIRYAYVASPAFDLNTASGRMIARMLAAKDAAEAEETSERIARAKRQRAEQGQYLGGYRAYCYEGAQYDDDGRLVNQGRINIALVQHEADTFRLIVQRIIAGERIATIVQDLNAQSIPSPDGKQWCYGNAKRILLKKRYVIFDDADPDKRGTLEHQGKEYRAEWPGLISRTTYELMCARLDEVSSNWKRGLSNGRVYLLSGIAVCECGKPMYGNGRYLPDKTYQTRYRCRSKDNSGNPFGCGKTFRGAEPLEDYVTEQVLAKLDLPDVVSAILDAPGDDTHVAELLTKLSIQREHRKQLLIDHGQGLYSRQDFQVILAAADDALALTQAELAKARSGQGTRVISTEQPVREAWDKSSLDWKRAVIELVVEKIIVRSGHPGSKMYKTWRFNPDFIEIVWRELSDAELSESLSALLATLRDALALAV